MTAIVRHDQAGLVQVDVASELPAIFTLARALVKAPGFMPPHLRTEGEIAAVILAGRELGIPPMASVRSIRLIKGNVTLDAAMQLALMVRAGCKVKWLDDGSSGLARLQLERAGQEPYVSRFSIEDAKQAGLAGSDNWRKHPAAMLRARCVTAAGKAYCPDVLAGVYLPDELPDAPVREVARDSHPMDETMHRTLAVLTPEELGAINAAGETVDVETGEIARAAAPDDLSPAEQIRMLVEVDLPRCVGRESLVLWARSLHSIATSRPGVKDAAWKAWAGRCGEYELQPAALAADARKAV